jgi:predicted TIM-barrel fold metal-dependent hydrolase
LNQAKEYLAHGYDGFKFLEAMPKYIKKLKYGIADQVYEPLWAYLEEQGTPILIHNGHPKKFWSEDLDQYWRNRGCFYGDGTYPDFYEIVNDMFTVLDRHPNLKITLAHMGFLEEDYDLSVKFLSYKNTMFDVTPGGAFTEYFGGNQRELWIDFIIKYSDRIKYGTDLYNFEKTTEEEWKICFHRRPDFIRQCLETDTEHEYAGKKFVGKKFDKKYRDKIYRENLLKELGLPKPIDFDWAIAKVKELRKEFSDTETLDGYDLMCMEYDFEELK